jgi:hypothetical protein
MGLTLSQIRELSLNVITHKFKGSKEIKLIKAYPNLDCHTIKARQELLHYLRVLTSYCEDIGKLHICLYGTKFHLCTNHSALTWLLCFKNLEVRWPIRAVSKCTILRLNIVKEGRTSMQICSLVDPACRHGPTARKVNDRQPKGMTYHCHYNKWLALCCPKEGAAE